MPKYVCHGAMISCPFSLPIPVPPPLEPPKEPPGPNPVAKPLSVLPDKMTNLENNPMANIMDFKPMVNVPSFGQCVAPTNPAVISAGGFPVPCVPAIAAPWMPRCPNTLVSNMPALLDTDMCICTTGAGQITFSSAGQTSISMG